MIGFTSFLHLHLSQKFLDALGQQPHFGSGWN